MTALQIHRATPADLDELRPLLAGYREFYGHEADAAGEHRFLHERLANHDSAMFIARENGDALGFVQLFLLHSAVRLAPVFVLEDLFVKPEARHRGAGNALLEHAKRHALKHRASGMSLETAHSNRTAQRLYESAGWKVESEFRKYNCPMTEPA